MNLKPDSIEQLQEVLPKASGLESFDLSSISQLVEHAPEDMTATVQAGMSLADFQDALAKHGQWLPVDPPFSADTSIGGLLAGNVNGPRRLGFGTVRDWLIGITVVLPDGKLARNGGKVVKNVAGFDLCKLFVGSRGTLGVIVEATFKLLPLPESEIFLSHACDSLEEAKPLIDKVWDSELQPHVLDLHQLDGAPPILTLGLAGAAADVEDQVQAANKMGLTDSGDLSHDELFRSEPHAVSSVPPGKLAEQLQGVSPFVARAGNGVFYHRGKPQVHKATALEKRIKEAFDPKGILPAP